MEDLDELHRKYIDSRNKYPQVRQKGELDLMAEIVLRIKSLESGVNVLPTVEPDREAMRARMAKARAARKVNAEAPDAA